MPRIAYAAPGAMNSAFAPIPAFDGRGFGPWSGKAAVAGQPGTLGVPTGSPDFGKAGLTVNGHSVRGGGAGYAQGSGTMPDVWYPSLYWLRGLDGSTHTVPGQGLAIWSDNQMPVPAADPIGRGAVLARPASFMGQQQLKQPPGSKGPAWPSWLPRLRYGS